MEAAVPHNAEQKHPRGPRELPPLPVTAGPATAPSPSPSPRPSFAERKGRYRSRQPSLEPVIEGDPRFLREVRDPPPGDTRPTRRLSKPDLAKRRSQYFEDAFQQGRNGSTVRDRVRDESMVVAEIKTNVIVPDEFTFITELSRHLSERYHRPLSSIVLTLQHRMCLYFGGSFAPAYSITISALPCQIQTATNKRNLLLLQIHLEKTLKVSPARGVVKYIPIAEECFGWSGRTIAGEMAEAAARAAPAEAGGQVRRRRTLPTLPIRRSSKSVPATHTGDVDKEDKGSEAAPNTEDRAGSENRPKTEGDRKLRPKKSFIHTLFQRPSKAVSEAPAEDGGLSAGSPQRPNTSAN